MKRATDVGLAATDILSDHGNESSRVYGSMHAKDLAGNPRSPRTRKRHPTMHSSQTIADPLKLAVLYRAGFGVHWNSYRQAATKLTTILEMKIGFARIREAVAVSELPPEILGLFAEVGLVNRTARELLKAAKAQGVASLVARARKADP